MKQYCGFLLLAACLKGTAIANPQNPHVVHGDVSFQNLSNAALQITASDKAIINWETFSIDATELTKFLQPSSQSTVLNRVQGSIPTSIMGTLEANGKIYLINPSGILVGPNGMVDTAGALFSTLELNDADFLAGGDITFLGDSQSSLINLGKISAQDGDVILLARHIQNEGSISTPNGDCLIGAGREIFLQTGGKDKLLIRLQSVEEKSGTGIDQSGQIEALRSEIKADGNLYAFAVKHTGKIDATRVASYGGEIYLLGENGNVDIDGSLTAPTEVRVAGNNIRLFEHTAINAANIDGGGSVHIGGGLRGEDPAIPNAEVLYVAKGCSIDASSKIAGDGGEVILWSDQATGFFGEIKSEGGRNAGNGGFVEVSSHNYLAFEGMVSAAAPFGKPGSLLLDPSNVTIQTNGGADSASVTFNSLGACALATPSDYSFAAPPPATIIDNTLLSTHLGNCSVTVNSNKPAGAGTGSITVLNNVTWNAPHSLTLTSSNSASDTITIKALIQNSDATMTTNDCIVITAPTVTLGDAGGVSSPELSAASGNININSSTGTTLYNATIQQTDNGGAAGKIAIFGGAFNANSVNGGAVVVTSFSAEIECNVDSITTSCPSPGSVNFFSQTSGNVIMQANTGDIFLDRTVGVYAQQTGAVTVECPNGTLTLNAINSNINALNGGAITVTANALTMDDSTLIGNSNSGFVQCTITNAATLTSDTAATTINSGTAGMTFQAGSLTIQAPTPAKLSGLIAAGGVLTCTIGGTADLHSIAPGTASGMAAITNTGTGGSIKFTADKLSIASGLSGQGAPPLYNGLITTDGDIDCKVTHDINLTSHGWFTDIRNRGAATARTITITSDSGDFSTNGGPIGANGANVINGNGDVKIQTPLGSVTIDVGAGTSNITAAANGSPATGNADITTGLDLNCKLSGGVGGTGQGGISSNAQNVILTTGRNFNMVGGLSVNGFTIAATQTQIFLTGDMNMLHDTAAKPGVPASGANGLLLIDGSQVSISRTNTPGTSNINIIGGSGSNAFAFLIGAANLTIDVNGDMAVTGGSGAGRVEVDIFSGTANISARNVTLTSGGSGALNAVRMGTGAKAFNLHGNGSFTVNATGNITVNSNTSIDTFGTATTNSITLNPANLVVNAGGQIIAGTGTTDGGTITVNASDSIFKNGTALSPAVIKMSSFSVGDMLLIANKNATINGTNTIEVLSASGALTLVVDNASPYNVSPNIGPGTLTISAGNTFTSGAVNHYIYSRIAISDFFTLPKNFGLFGEFRGQISNQNLVPSEQFGLGGYDTVRGYAERVVN